MPEQLLQRPPVKHFLDAVDEVMNSNTFLIDAGPTLGSLSAWEIADYVQSEDFTQAMFACDRIRDWWSYHDSEIENDELVRHPSPGSFTVENPAINSEPATVEDFRQRLLWMLTEAFCPYAGRGAEHRSPEVARALVDRFLGALDVKASTQVVFVEPIFLHSTRYWVATEDDPPIPDHHLPYFDGPQNESDTATFWITDEVGYLLLTNGSP